MCRILNHEHADAMQEFYQCHFTLYLVSRFVEYIYLQGSLYNHNGPLVNIYVNIITSIKYSRGNTLRITS